MLPAVATRPEFQVTCDVVDIEWTTAQPLSDRNFRLARPARRSLTRRVRMNNGKDKGLSCNQAFMHESVMGMNESSLPMPMRNGRWCTPMKRKNRITGSSTGTQGGQHVCRASVRHVV